MGDLQPVRPPPTPLSGHGTLIGGLVVVALLVAIVKPWGAVGGGVPTRIAEATPTPTPSPTPTPAAQIGYSDRRYDPSIFGDAEPAAVWGIWPTGFLVTFGFVVQIPDGPTASSAVGPPAPVATLAADGGPTWPTQFTVPTGSHILLIGIDMPPGIAVESVTLRRLEADGSLVNVPVERFPSPWPAHFAVIGLPLGTSDSHLEIWPAGHYRLDLAFGPGQIRRSMDIVIT